MKFQLHRLEDKEIRLRFAWLAVESIAEVREVRR